MEREDNTAGLILLLSWQSESFIIAATSLAIFQHFLHEKRRTINVNCLVQHVEFAVCCSIFLHYILTWSFTTAWKSDTLKLDLNYTKPTSKCLHGYSTTKCIDTAAHQNGTKLLVDTVHPVVYHRSGAAWNYFQSFTAFLSSSLFIKSMTRPKLVLIMALQHCNLSSAVEFVKCKVTLFI